MPRVLINNIDLTFRVRQHRHSTLKETLLGRWRTPSNPLIDIHALKSIDLAVNDGDRLAILGHNGAGKSTLLKLVAGIYPPSTGTCVTQGRIGSLFDLTAGLEQEATGWENIKFRSYLQGDTPRNLSQRSQEVAEFSGLGRYLNVPIRYYSAGMVVRLAFSIATAVDPEILLIDEVIGVGDAQFQQQAFARVQSMMQRAHVVLLASHSIETLEQHCNRAIWLDQGSIRRTGSCQEVAEAYSKCGKRSCLNAA